MGWGDLVRLPITCKECGLNQSMVPSLHFSSIHPVTWLIPGSCHRVVLRACATSTLQLVFALGYSGNRVTPGGDGDDAEGH